MPHARAHRWPPASASWRAWKGEVQRRLVAQLAAEREGVVAGKLCLGGGYDGLGGTTTSYLALGHTAFLQTCRADRRTLSLANRALPASLLRSRGRSPGGRGEAQHR